MALVVRHVEQVRLTRLLLQFIARALVVGVVHVYQPLGGLRFQIQLAISHSLCELSILLSIVSTNLIGVYDAMAVPGSRIVISRSNTDLV